MYQKTPVNLPLKTDPGIEQCSCLFIIVFEVVNRSNVVYCTKEKEYHEYVSDRSVI